ncbi:MAG: DMT family transporter [Erysipelotrichaceae bacterium]|nr:DMT family transporter [Erysipelotrichaceae bacterium]
MKQTAEMKLITAVIVFGTISLFVRRIPMTSGEIALFRAVLAVVLIGLYLILTKNLGGFRRIRKQLPLLLLSGAAMGFNWILLFEAYRYTTVSAATLSYYFAPVIVTVLCPIVFHEEMTLRHWICFVMSTLGIVLITGIGDLSTGSSHLTGILYGLGAACLYAFVIMMNKMIQGVEGIHRTFLQFLAAVIVVFPYVMMTGGISFARMDTVGWLCLLTVGAVHTGITYCLYFSALKELPGQKTAILSYLDPLTAVMISVLILSEPISAVQILGGLLILGFTLWNELGS